MIDEDSKVRIQRVARQMFEEVASDVFAARLSEADAYEPVVYQMQHSDDNIVRAHALRAFDHRSPDREEFRKLVTTEISRFM